MRTLQFGLALLLGLGVASCAGLAARVAYSDAESLCKRDRGECERRCDADRSRAAECDVLLVSLVKTQDLSHEDPDTLGQYERKLANVCAQGITEACRARARIASTEPSGKASGTRDRRPAVNLKARVSAAAAELDNLDGQAKAMSRKTHQSPPVELTTRLKRAREALMLGQIWGGGDPSKVTEAETIAQEMRAWLQAQEGILAKKQAQESAERSWAEAKRKYAEDVKNAISECEKDTAACKKSCEARDVSNSCYGLAVLMFDGSSKIPKNRKGARELAQATCNAQLRQECIVVASFDRVEAKEKKKQQAQADLPKFLAKCNQHHQRKVSTSLRQARYEFSERLSPTASAARAG